MPTYEYRCERCGEVSERNVKVDNRYNVWYCWCGGAMKRQFGVGGVYVR